MSGDVGGWRIGDRAEVTERKLGDQGAGVIGVERAPAAVTRLHTCGPLDCLAQGGVDPGLVGMGNPAQAQDHFGCVVGIGVVVIGELECPCTRRQLGPSNGPVSGSDDLLIQQPVGGIEHRRIVRGNTSLQQRGQRQRGIPHRRLAAFESPGRSVGRFAMKEEALETGKAGDVLRDDPSDSPSGAAPTASTPMVAGYHPRHRLPPGARVSIPGLVSSPGAAAAGRDDAHTSAVVYRAAGIRRRWSTVDRTGDVVPTEAHRSQTPTDEPVLACTRSSAARSFRGPSNPSHRY